SLPTFTGRRQLPGAAGCIRRRPGKSRPRVLLTHRGPPAPGVTARSRAWFLSAPTRRGMATRRAILARSNDGTCVRPRWTRAHRGNLRRVLILRLAAARSRRRITYRRGQVAEWQTRTVQVRVSVRTWGFNSPLAHPISGVSCADAPGRSFLLVGGTT